MEALFDAEEGSREDRRGGGGDGETTQQGIFDELLHLPVRRSPPFTPNIKSRVRVAVSQFTESHTVVVHTNYIIGSDAKREALRHVDLWNPEPSLLEGCPAEQAV
jgi:hypothetical protein